MKSIYIIFSLSFFVLMQNFAFAQCNNFNNNYPQSLQSNPGTSTQVVATDMSAGDWVVFNVTQGVVYEWTTCGDLSFDTYLSVYDMQGNLLKYNDDYCGLQSKIVWMATNVGKVKVLLSAYGCQTNTSANMTLEWKELQNPYLDPITGVIPDPKQLLICGSTPDTVIAQALGNCTGNFEFRFLEGATVVQAWSTQDFFIASPAISTTYTVEARCSAIPATVSSDTFRVDVIAEPIITGNLTLCAGDSTMITASGSTGDFEWWTDSVGGTQLDTTGVFFTPAMNSSNTYWVQANGMGAGGGAAVLISECATETITNSDDYIEIANLYSVPVNTTGWVVAISDNYSNINAVDATYWHLSGSMGPCQVDYRQDNSSLANYWGGNMMWNPGTVANGGTYNSWAIIIDNLGNIVDFLAWGWTAAEIATFNTTINGHNVTIGTEWTGPGDPSNCGAGAATNSHQRTGNADSNTMADWTCQMCTQNVLNPGLSCGWVSVSCRFPVDIIVNPNPTITATATPDSICVGENADISATSSGSATTYIWDNGLGNGQTHSVSPATTTTYSVTGTDLGCTGTTDVILNVVDIPTFTLGSTDDHCGQNIGSVFVQSNSGNTFLWNTTPSSTLDSVTTLGAGTYAVKVSNALCSDSSTIVVNDIAGPVASFTVNPQVALLGQTVNCTDMSIGATTWNWTFGPSLGTSIVQNPFFSFYNEGTYTIYLTVTDDYACMDSTSREVTVSAPYTFYVPNAFTPDNDGINDYFIPKGIYVDEDRYSMTIFNRWGEPVFETQDVNQGWDGRVNTTTIESTEVSSDTYIYVIKLYDVNGEYHEYMGQVNLIR
jgi:gliding motility-associated-like protein